MDRTKNHFDKIAENYDYYKTKNKYYYDHLKGLLSKLIPQKQTVFEIGCGTGELLVYTKPKVGYGMDISEKMIGLCKQKYKDINNLHFSTNDVLTFRNKHINYIFMSDVVEHVSDVKTMFKNISLLMGKQTKFICTYANPIWEPFLVLAEKLKLKMPEGKHFRRSFKELRKVAEKCGLEIIEHNFSLLLPVRVFSISDCVNKYLGNVFKKCSFIEYFIALKK